MSNLASTYGENGRHSDALALREHALEIFRRESHDDHPQIGVT